MLAAEHKTYYLDMRKEIPQDKDYFCDICHLREKGCQLFAGALARYILTNKILEDTTKVKNGV